MLIKWLPNLISLARICTVPITLWLIISDAYVAAFWLFVAAGLSDAVDGFIAKQFDAQTVIGGFLDPLADKMLLVGVYLTLGGQGHIPIWLVILVVFRDLLIIGGALLFETLTHSLEMTPLTVSKINTLSQIVLAALVLGDLSAIIRWPESHLLITVMTALTVLTTLLSGGAYLLTWGRRMMLMERDRDHD